MNRLTLGTAQLGTSYGITNRTGQPDYQLAEMIIQKAFKLGVLEYDTAQCYGKSEQFLGKALDSLGISNKIKIVSKISPNFDHLSFNEMEKAIAITLSNLRIPRVYCIMLHREELLDSYEKGLGEILSGFVQEGLVECIGASVYSPGRAIQALNFDGISVVQIPSNLLDARFEKAGVFKLADDNKKQVYVRSVFLQGLLLMNCKDVPEKMHYAIPVLEKLETFAKKIHLSKIELALGYAKIAYPNAKIIFGAETPEQVFETVAHWKKEFLPEFVPQIRNIFQDVEEKLVNPSLW